MDKKIIKECNNASENRDIDRQVDLWLKSFKVPRPCFGMRGISPRRDVVYIVKVLIVLHFYICRVD
jgi:hypothetical protein